MAHDWYRALSEDKKIRKGEYGRNPYQNISKEKKTNNEKVWK